MSDLCARAAYSGWPDSSSPSSQARSCCATKGARRWHGGCCACRSQAAHPHRQRRALFDTLGILTASGVPLLTSLQSAAGVVTIADARRGGRGGAARARRRALAPALGAAKLFPPLVIT